MDLLTGTPYSLQPDTGPQIVASAVRVAEDVTALRQRGALEPATLARLRNEWGFQQVYESAGIEGNQLTLSETTIAIQRGITISGKPPEHSDEVRHLYEAQKYLEDLAGKQTPLAESEIKDVQALVLGRGNPDAGRYRTVVVELSGSPHKPPHPIKVPEQMEDYARWLHSDAAAATPIPLRAAVAHAWLVHIHPFRDGNGRTARAVLNLLLMRAGYPVVIIRRRDRLRYYEALRTSDDGDIGPLLELVTERLQDSLLQIDRNRAAATGITFALEKIRAAEERQYRLWADGLQLLATAFDDAVRGLREADDSFDVEVTNYGRPEFDEWQLLRNRQSAGNSWLLKIRIRRHGTLRQVLLWSGFSSDAVVAALKPKTPAMPTIWISAHRPNEHPAWGLPDDTFPSKMREIAFHDGRFFVRFHNGDVHPRDGVVTIASQFISNLLSWFSPST
ncbi:MAG: Fic family protein [Planctomycetota bacterium]|nr:Fic family protein [Planctomycetota bacterium]